MEMTPERWRYTTGYLAEVFGALPEGFQVQFAPALVGRRRDGFLAAAVTPAALDRFVALMLEPFGQSKDLEQGFGYAANGRQTPVAVVPGGLGAGVDGDQSGAAQIAAGSFGSAPAQTGFFGQKRQR